MKILLNTTKTMDLETPAPAGLKTSRPRFQREARALMDDLQDLDLADLSRVMDLGDALAAVTRTDLALWGRRGRPRRPALFAFTGLVFKHLDARSLPRSACLDAQNRLRILSGLYGLLRPLDAIEAYRLEMGCKFRPTGAASLTAFWKARLADALNRDLADGEPILDLASGEYLKAVDRQRLRGPVISPVFKQRRDDGSLKVVTVHAKQARGLMARYVLTEGVQDPAELGAFAADGWEAAGEPPASGDWLFTR